MRTLKGLACVLLAAIVCAAGAQEGRAGAGRARAVHGRGKLRPVTYLALGDSTGAGVGAEHGGYVQYLFARISRARPGSRLVNLSASAAASADLLGEQVGRVGEARPTLVTVGVGANDLIRGVPAEKFARNFDEIVVRLRQQTDAPVVLMSIPDISLAPGVPAYMRDHVRRHIRVFNERIEEVARRHGLPVVDLFSRSAEFSSHPEFFSRDGLHPSDAGYDFWAGLLWPHAEKLIAGRAPARAGRRGKSPPSSNSL